MLQRGRKLVGLVLALLLSAAVVLPGSAAAAPKPLAQEWWFPAWGVDDLLWPISKGAGVTVAVIDTGVQSNVPDLRNAVLPGMDAESGSGDGRTDGDTGELHGHGTAMASLIAAQGTGTGLVGVAPEAKILPIVGQSTDAYAKGIRYATDHGAKVVNLSQAVPGACPANLQESIAYALDKDVVIVAGAGNDGAGGNASNSPANCKGVLAVGAVDAQLRPWEKTQRQPYVTVAGPGVRAPVVVKSGKLISGSGTSAASALTSGAIALVRAKFPEMKNRELVRQLIASAKDVSDKGQDDRTGYGMVRPYRLLAQKAPQGSANPVFEDYDRWAKRHRPSARPKAEKDSDDGMSTGTIIGFGAIGAFWLVVLVIVFVIARRRRGKGGPPPGPPPFGPGAGPGVPPGFGQSGRPGFQPPVQPGQPPGQYQPPGPPQGGGPPTPR
ncbi:S8 family serine peptidase [Actinomadura litoris]|uniref:S8 family serine peptidase n=1 Tax=Actinomadura litoris TaxID=2678616 RepID=A0A7K1KS36_9ACTN|nr:S8 family serine peptidase [Actinomadura litoris]MUN34998.1 S8 family serine peptidase [Actinomadura litoris]